MQLVTRKMWKAAPAKSRPTDLRRSDVDTIVAHYTAADADEQAQHSLCDERVRGIQRFHQETRGWNDIAYNLLVCKHGFVFQGRGAFRKSAATGADNNHTVAVCFLGDDTQNRSDLTEDGRQALVDAFQYVEDLYDKRLLYRGHRDFMATSCPGDEIMAFIKSDGFAKRVRGTR